MQHNEEFFEGADNKRIYYQVWGPKSPARGLVLIVHGAAEHGGRYSIFANYFTGQGYAVAALDQIGHGKSEGGRCCIRSFDDHVTNLETFRQRVSSQFPGIPVFLLGHSMGGLVSCYYLLKNPGKFAGCILSGPAIMTELEPPWYQLLVIRLLSLLAPNAGALQLDARGVSRDAAEVERYRNDPLNHTGKLSARMIAELFRVMGLVQQRAAQITTPLLLMHGGADSMAAPKGSEFLHRAAGSADKTLKIYPGLYHEIFNEPEREEVFRDVAAWLLRHC